MFKAHYVKKCRNYSYLYYDSDKQRRLVYNQLIWRKGRISRALWFLSKSIFEKPLKMDFETCAFQGLILSLKLICFLNTGFEGGERSARRVPKKPRFRAPWAKFSIRPWGRGYHRMCFYFCFYTIGWPLMSNIFSLKCKKKVAELVLTVRTWREMTKTLKKFPKNTKNEKTRVFLWTCDFMIGFLLLHGCNCRWPPNMWRKINPTM